MPCFLLRSYHLLERANLILHFPVCNHVWQAQILRFFMGLFEAVSFAGAHYVVGSWYKPEEMAKRACLVTASINMGALFSGVLQGSIFDSMNGRLGFAGWRVSLLSPFLTYPRAGRHGSWKAKANTVFSGLS